MAGEEFLMTGGALASITPLHVMAIPMVIILLILFYYGCYDQLGGSGHHIDDALMRLQRRGLPSNAPSVLDEEVVAHSYPELLKRARLFNVVAGTTKHRVLYLRPVVERPKYQVLYVCEPPLVCDAAVEVAHELRLRGMRVFATEQLGFGFSQSIVSAQARKYTIEDYAAWLESLCAKLFTQESESANDVDGEDGAHSSQDQAQGTGPTKNIVVVHGSAALYAMVAAKRNPDLIHSLVFVQAPSFEHQVSWAHGLRGPYLSFMHPWLSQLVTQLTRVTTSARLIDMFISDEGKCTSSWSLGAREPHSDATNSQVLVALLKRVVTRAFEHGAGFPIASLSQLFYQWHESICDFDALVPRNSIRQPVMLMWGGQDSSHTHVGSDPNSSRIYFLEPKVSETVVEDAGHFVDIQQPHAFASSVATWLATIS
eukprot:m.187902 g.187902  ORF g.187902 m.187902 type:complete len:427 (-) comp14785_c0_seq1:2361-3641(-)